ncbi:MAG: AI-2E family transporter [Clostridia bacterium]|nr:AI-2E family transporter [Clostridia bacterium]
MNKKTAAQLIAFGVLLAAAVFNLRDAAAAVNGVIGVFKPVLLGFAFAFFLNIPLCLIQNIDKKNRTPRFLQILFSLIVVIIIVACVLLILVPQLIQSASALFAKLPYWFEQIKQFALRIYNYPQFNDWLNSLTFNLDDIAGRFIGFLRSGAFDAISSAANVATGVVGDVTGVVIAFIIGLGVVSCKERLCSQASRVIRAFIKPSHAERIISTCRMTHHAYVGFFSAQLTEAAILGILVMLGMLIIGFPRPFMVATMVAIGALIPLFGAFVAALTAAFFLAAEFSLSDGCWFMAFFIILQQIEGNVIYPRVMGSRIGLPSVWVLMAVVVGGNAMGIAGMILFVPLASVVYQLIAHEVKRREKVKCETATAQNRPESVDGKTVG